MKTEPAKRKKRLFSTVALIAVGGFALLFFGYQIMLVFFSPYKTETAVSFSVTDEIPCAGIAVRDELLLQTDTEGFYVYKINNGDKIAKNAVVAELYATGGEVDTLVRLETLRAERDLLIRLSNYDTKTTEFDVTKEQLAQAVLAASGALSDCNLTVCLDRVGALTEALGVYTQTVGATPDYAARISRLNALIAELEAKNVAPTGVLRAAETGYFITATDGFEALADMSKVSSMTVADIVALIGHEPDARPGAKLISDYEWYYCAVLDSAYAKRFRTGATLTLNFNYAGVTGIPAQVVSVTTDEELGKTAVVFLCSYFNSSTASLRLENALVSFKAYKGIRIDRSALRLYEGETGVYIKYGDYVRFRRISILYETDDYVLASASDTRSGYLKLYDEIIVAGRNIYPGKNIS